MKHPEYAIDGLTLSRFSFLTPKPLQENYVRKRRAMRSKEVPQHDSASSGELTKHFRPSPTLTPSFV